MGIKFKIRIFGSDQCDYCSMALDILKHFKVNFQYIDAFDDSKSIQKICDKYNVDELPHLQVIKNDKVIDEYIGSDDFLLFVKEYLKK